MPRLSRLDALGVLHHVMGRSIEKKKFLNDKGRVDFIDRLTEVVEKGGMDIYPWALIPKLRGGCYLVTWSHKFMHYKIWYHPEKSPSVILRGRGNNYPDTGDKLFTFGTNAPYCVFRNTHLFLMPAFWRRSAHNTGKVDLI